MLPSAFSSLLSRFSSLPSLPSRLFSSLFALFSLFVAFRDPPWLYQHFGATVDRVLHFGATVGAAIQRFKIRYLALRQARRNLNHPIGRFWYAAQHRTQGGLRGCVLQAWVELSGE